MSNLQDCISAFRTLRADGLFVDITELTDTDMGVIATTYMTDTDKHNLDCLLVDEQTEHAGDGPCNVCESFTMGLDVEAVAGSICCPMCNRQTKPWSLRPRVKTANFTITPTGLTLQPGTMHAEMAAKIISAYDMMISSQRGRLDLDGPNPGLVVFDLDNTLWNYDCGLQVLPPFTMEDGHLIDGLGRPANPFPDVPGIIAALVDAGIPVAYASRNQAADYLEELLRAIPIECKNRPAIKSLWDVIPRRSYFQAYDKNGLPGKTRHFKALEDFTGVPPSKMLFFDDGPSNTVPAEEMGIASVLLEHGLTWEKMNAGLRKWRGIQLERTPIEDDYDEPDVVDINFIPPLYSPFEAEDATNRVK